MKPSRHNNTTFLFEVVHPAFGDRHLDIGNDSDLNFGSRIGQSLFQPDEQIAYTFDITDNATAPRADIDIKRNVGLNIRVRAKAQLQRRIGVEDGVDLFTAIAKPGETGQVGLQLKASGGNGAGHRGLGRSIQSGASSLADLASTSVGTAAKATASKGKRIFIVMYLVRRDSGQAPYLHAPGKP